MQFGSKDGLCCQLSASCLFDFSADNLQQRKNTSAPAQEIALIWRSPSYLMPMLIRKYLEFFRGCIL